MSFCKNCGAKIEGDEKFCPNCGSSFNTSSKTNKRDKKPKKGDCLKYIIIVLIIIVLFVGAAFAFLWYEKTKSKEVAINAENMISTSEEKALSDEIDVFGEKEGDKETTETEEADPEENKKGEFENQAAINTKNVSPEPYQIENGNIEDILMGGDTYRDVLKIWSDGGIAYYNLNNKFTAFSAVYAFRDESSSNSGASLYFYGDNNLIQEVIVEGGQLPKDILLDLTGVYQLKIEARPIEGYGNADIGIGNISFS